MPILNRDKTIDPKKALQKPSTSSPGVIQPASISSKAFKTRLKIPIVKKFIGSVTSFNTGFIKVFIKAIITQANIALRKLLTSIPGITHAVKIIASAKHIHLTNITA